MKLTRYVVVFDAADVEAESAFWAAMLDGQVVDDDTNFHCVIDADEHWLIGVQRAPGHVPPQWPDGNPQQIHLDLHVEDLQSAHDRAVSLGATLLQPAADPDAEEGFQVYADPAVHPFCLGWGHPTEEQVRQFLANRG